MPDFGAPSRQEAQFYYHGLRTSGTGVKSGPILVYRTSIDVFPAPGERPEDRKMQLLPVRGHQRLDKDDLWDTVCANTVKILDQYKVKVTSVDLVRFGWKAPYSNATITGNPTIWIGVFPNSTSAKVAGLSAKNIQTLLGSHQMNDIDIAFRETEAYQFVVPGPQLYPPFAVDDTLRDVTDWVTTSLSIPIAALDTPDREGTFGFYFKFGEDLYGVTARHVIFPAETDSNACYRYTENPSSIRDKKWVVLAGDESFEALLLCSQRAIDNMDACLKTASKSLHTTRYRNPYDTTKLADLQHQVDEYQTKLNTLKLFDLGLKNRNQWSTTRNRIIGHVVWAPPISTHPYTQDVCVLKLVNEKFLPSLEHHVVQTATGHGPRKLEEDPRFCMKRHDDFPATFPWPLEEPYRLTKILPIEDIGPTNEAETMVFKCGRTTGTTLGIINKFTSYRREYRTNHIFESREVAILSYKGDWGSFSRKGDSGAAIIGGNHDFVALLTGGLGTTNSTDITYCTPFEWLWQEVIKREFPTAELFF